MADLGIGDISIGFSKKGATAYAESMANSVTSDVFNSITDGKSTLTDALQTGWSGAACESYIKKLDESSEKLKDVLMDMADAFKASVNAQVSTYGEEDNSMSEVISGTNIL